MPTQKKHLLIFSFFLATCLFTNTTIAKDLAQSKSTDTESPAKSTLDKKPPKKQTNKHTNLPKKHLEIKKKAPGKKTVATGYCITHNKLTSQTEASCKRRKGAFFSNKKQAQKFIASNTNGFCLQGQTISSSKRTDCSKKGAQFFKNRQQAKSALARVNGFCVDDDTVIATSYGQCRNKHGIFFTDKGAARKKALINKKKTTKKANTAKSRMTPSASKIRSNKLSGKQRPATGTINHRTPKAVASDHVNRHFSNRHIKDRIASMKDAQAAKDAGLTNADPGAKKKSHLTNPLTGETIILGRTLRDPITGKEIGRSGMERNHFDEIGKISGDRQHDGTDHTDEMRAAARRGGNGMAMADSSSDRDSTSSDAASSNKATSPPPSKSKSKSPNPLKPVPADPKKPVGGTTVVDEKSGVTMEEAIAMMSNAQRGDKTTGKNKQLGTALTLMKTGESSVLVTRTMSNGAKTEQHFELGEKPGVPRYIDPDKTEHPDEQRGSRNDKKRKALTYMDLAGNPGQNARNAKEQNRKKQIFTKDDLAGNPNPQNAERKGKSRALPDAIMTDLTLSGTPVEADTDFGKIDPQNPSGNSTHSSNTSSNRQIQGNASLPSTGSNRNLVTDRQQEEPVVVPDNQ